jgi:hypothetical protein
MDDHNVRRQFRVITEAAGLGKAWVRRELRHTFVSLLSAHGVAEEAIAELRLLPLLSTHLSAPEIAGSCSCRRTPSSRR